MIYGIWFQRIAAGRLRAAVGAGIAAVTAVCLVSYERHNVQREDWRAAARYVAAHAQPGDMVLIYDPDRMLPFNYYFAALAPGIPVHGVPIDIVLERYNPYVYTIRDTVAVAARIQALGATTRPLWFVSASRLLDHLKGGPDEVLRYLRVHDRLDPPVLFTRVRVDHAEPH